MDDYMFKAECVFYLKTQAFLIYDASSQLVPSGDILIISFLLLTFKQLPDLIIPHSWYLAIYFTFSHQF